LTRAELLVTLHELRDQYTVAQRLYKALVWLAEFIGDDEISEAVEDLR
jgi:hypothetical protein